MVTNYVTTFDGASGFPLGQTNANFSQELRPRANQAGVYEADYITYDSWGGCEQYGSFTVYLPTTDTDGNGIPDFAQKEMVGNASFSGALLVDWPIGASTSLSGLFRRDAGSLAGTYSVVVLGGVSATYNGSFHLLRLEGTVTYARGTTNLMALHLTRFDRTGNTTTLDGFTTFKDRKSTRLNSSHRL